MAQQLPPEIPPEVLAQMQQQGPMQQGPMQEAPMQEAPMQEAPPQEGIIDAPIESNALQMDDEVANKAAIEIISSAKEEMYGDKFDTYMEMLQQSDNLVEDLAMISIDLLMPEINAAASTNGIPYSYGMDIAADVVSEAYDMAVQTGIYEPSSEEELLRNQNITLTMVAGELGKEFGGSGTIPESDVSNFIDTVVDGGYDNYVDPNGDLPADANPEDVAMMAPEMAGMPPGMEGMPPPPGAMAPPGAPQGLMPEEEQGLIQGGRV
jgi:hypothetical protein